MHISDKRGKVQGGVDSERDFMPPNSSTGEETEVHVMHSDASTDEDSSSGRPFPNHQEKISRTTSRSIRRHFTPVSSASLQCGLADAMNILEKSTDMDPRPLSANVAKLQRPTIFVMPTIISNDIEKGLINGYRSKSKEENGSTRSATVRKLFDDNILDQKDEATGKEHHSEKEDAEIKINHSFAGLSYVSSQEPGEFSQTNALTVVDKYLNMNNVESLEEAEPIRNEVLMDKSSPASLLKGRLNLAHKTNPGVSLSKAEIFDWIDNHEDDGGGEFFCKRRNFLLGNEHHKSLTEPRKRRHTNSKSPEKAGVKADSDPHIHQKLMNIIHSDTLLSKSRKCDQIRSSDVLAKKNIYNELDEQIGEECGHAVDAVGVSTQLAAEAMEALGHMPPDSHGQCGLQPITKGIDENYGRVHGPKIYSRTEHLMQKSPLEKGREKHMDDLDIKSSTLVKKKHSKTQVTNSHSCRSSRLINGTTTPVALRTRKSVTRGKTRLSESELVSNCKRRSSHVVVEHEMNGFRGLKKNIHVQYKNKQKNNLKRDSETHISKITCQNVADGVQEQAANLKGSPNGTEQTFISLNAISPVCAVDQTIDTNRCISSRSSCMRELISLDVKGVTPHPTSKDTRRRREMSNARVLFSHHLGEERIKQQKKILTRLRASVASSLSDATHFVADEFVRTRNMLEAIALGKPVVNHLWLESCAQAGCCLDEKPYILKDQQKEKEIGFSMAGSLARAWQHPLLQGRRVFLTPNIKPSSEIVTALVAAAGGQAFERMGRSAKDKISEDFLVISCEEDFLACVPFLEKGAEVYSSELLLNGIVIQKLEYQRHRLFADNVKRTRSTVWLRNERESKFRPVGRCI